MQLYEVSKRGSLNHFLKLGHLALTVYFCPLVFKWNLTRGRVLIGPFKSKVSEQLPLFLPPGRHRGVLLLDFPWKMSEKWPFTLTSQQRIKVKGFVQLIYSC